MNKAQKYLEDIKEFCELVAPAAPQITFDDETMSFIVTSKGDMLIESDDAVVLDRTEVKRLVNWLQETFLDD